MTLNKNIFQLYGISEENACYEEFWVEEQSEKLWMFHRSREGISSLLTNWLELLWCCWWFRNPAITTWDGAKTLLIMGYKYGWINCFTFTSTVTGEWHPDFWTCHQQYVPHPTCVQMPSDLDASLLRYSCMNVLRYTIEDLFLHGLRYTLQVSLIGSSERFMQNAKFCIHEYCRDGFYWQQTASTFYVFDSFYGLQRNGEEKTSLIRGWCHIRIADLPTWKPYRINWTKKHHRLILWSGETRRPWWKWTTWRKQPSPLHRIMTSGRPETSS